MEQGPAVSVASTGAAVGCQPSVAPPCVGACSIAAPIGLVQSGFTRIALAAKGDEIGWFGGFSLTAETPSAVVAAAAIARRMVPSPQLGVGATTPGPAHG